MSFSTSFTTDSVACLLGVTQEKPKLQTLLHITFEANYDILFVKQQGGPKVSTSHQLFQQFVEQHHGCRLPAAVKGQSVDVNVDVWQYDLKWVDNCSLIACASALSEQFVITSSKVSIKRGPKVELPFGLKLPRRKRSSKKGAAAVKRLKGATGGPTASHGHQCEGESSSDASSAGSSLDKGGADNADAGNIENLHDESQPIEPISETMLDEANKANALCHEVATTDKQREELAEQCHTGAKASSYFSKTFGLDAGSIAVSGRSMCLFCKLRIPKGDVRFSWYYSTVRPNAWVHSHCLFQLAQQTGLQDSTIKVLRGICSQSSGSSGPDTVQQSAEGVLQAFNSE